MSKSERRDAWPAGVISYSRRDQPSMERLVACLTEAGIPVWVDYEAPYGDLWEHVIKEQL